MKPKNKIYLNPIIIGLFIFILLSIFMYRERVKLCRQTFAPTRNSLTAAASIIQGVIRYQYHCGQLKQMNVILQNIIETSDIKYIILKQGDKEIFEAGTKTEFPDKNSNAGVFIYNRRFYYKKMLNRLSSYEKRQINNKLHFANNSFQTKYSRHKPDRVKKRNKRPQISLGIVMDDRQYFKQIRDGNIKLLIFYIICCIAILIFIFAWIFFSKSNNLKTEIKAIKTRTDQLEELGLAAAGLAHETKNPLGIIRGFAQKILKFNNNDILLNRKIASMIIDEVDVTTERLSDFMNYAKFRTIEKIPIQAKNKIIEIMDLLQPEFEFAGIKLTAELEDITIEADIETLSQIIINLAQNSLEACSKGNKIVIKLLTVGDCAEFSVVDDGPGIDSKILNEIYKPYVKGNPNGHGIGLTIVKRFVDDSDWKITAYSSPGKGTSMVINKIKIL